MGKYIGFTICLIVGMAVIALSVISENFYCSHPYNACLVQSKFGMFDIVLSEDRFSPSEIDKVFCDVQVQPSRSGGKKQFYVLKIALNSDKEYSLGSYKKYHNCKNLVNKINDFRKHKVSEYTHGSGLGYSNTFGLIFGIIMFFIGYLILTSKEEVKKYDWEDEEEEETK